MRLTGKNVVIVGGTSGIGKATARLSLLEGASVTVVGRSSERLSAAVAELQALGLCRGIVCDVTDERRVDQLWEQVGHADHLVITAAGDLVYKPFLELTAADMNRALTAKLIGAFLLVQRGYSRLEKEGSVVFTAGINAFVPPGKSSAVSAANGGLIAYARALAVELSPLRVNVVSPGWTDTPIWSGIATGIEKDRMFASHAQMLPVRRIGEPEDIAGAIMMLLQNKFMTGAVVHVDGGRRLI